MTGMILSASHAGQAVLSVEDTVKSVEKRIGVSNTLKIYAMQVKPFRGFGHHLR